MLQYRTRFLRRRFSATLDEASGYGPLWHMLDFWQAIVEKTECKDIGHVDRGEHKLD